MFRLDVRSNDSVFNTKQEFVKKNSQLNCNFDTIIEKISKLSSNKFDVNKVKNVSIEISGDKDFIFIQADQLIKIDLNSLSLDLKKEIVNTIEVINHLPIFKNEATLVGSSVSYTFNYKIESNILLDFKNYFKNLFSFYFTCRPAIAKQVDEELKKFNVDDFEHLYLNKNNLFKCIKENLDPQIMIIFGEVDIDNLINAELIKKMNHLLILNKKEVWDTEKMSSLDFERQINNIIAKPNALYLIQQLKNADPLRIPFALLAKIPVTKENEQMALSLWLDFTIKLYEQGNFNAPVERLDAQDLFYEAAAAEAYHEALKAMPNPVKKGVIDYLNDANYLLPQEIKENLLHRQQKYCKINGNVDFGSISTLYRTKLLDKFHKYIQEVYQDEEGVSNILFNLAGEYAHKFDIRREPTGDAKTASYESALSVNEMARNLRNELTPQEKEFYTEERIKHLFIAELEKVALKKFHLLSPQIAALKEMRTKAEEKRGLKDIIMAHVIPLQFRHIQEKILTTEIIDSIKKSNEQYCFDIEQQQCLMRIDKLLLKAKNKEHLSDYERLQFSNNITKLRQSKNFEQKMKKFTTKKSAIDAETLKTYYKFFPQWTHKIIDWLFIEKRLPELIAPAGISTDTLQTVKEYSDLMIYYSKNKKTIENLIAKGKGLVKKFKTSPKSIAKHERYTLKELGILSKFTRVVANSDLPIKEYSIYLDINMPGYNEEAKEFSLLNKQAIEIFGHFTDICMPIFDKGYKNGSLMAYSADKKTQWSGKSLTIDERVTGFFGGYTHGAKLYNKDGQLQISEVQGNYRNQRAELYAMLISDTWEFDLTPLFNNNMAAHLKLIKGKEWNKYVNDKFQEKEKELHSNVANGKLVLTNNFSRRIRAALAEFPKVSNLFFSNVKSHKRENERDFTNIMDDYYVKWGVTGKEVMCSEFASKATIATMMKLNETLSAEIDAHYKYQYSGKTVLAKLQGAGPVPDDVVAYLKGKRWYKKDYHLTQAAEKKLISLLEKNGYKGASLFSPGTNEIELIFRIGNKEIFDLPYSRKERLKAIHPGRMVSLLKKCLIPVVPEDLTRLVAM